MSDNPVSARRATPDPIEVGQIWRDPFGNDFEVTGRRRDGRYTLYHLKWCNARHILPGDLRANFELGYPREEEA